MAFFDRMKDSLTTAGQEVSQKAKNATENVRLGNLIKNNDKMVDKLLYQVGLKYYVLSVDLVTMQVQNSASVVELH